MSYSSSSSISSNDEPNHAEKVLTFRPTAQQFSNFPKYIKYLESRGAHKAGICKIIPPENWTPNKELKKTQYKSTFGLTIDTPIQQTFISSGNQARFTCINEEKPRMKVADIHKMSEKPKYSPPTNVMTLQDLESKYWKNIKFNPPTYGSDHGGSLFSSETKDWNMSKLNSVLDCVKLGQDKIDDIPGVTSPYLYFGMWRSSFCWHREDCNLYALNYLHHGCSKQWYAIPPKHAKKFLGLAKRLHPDQYKACKGFVHHKTLLMKPKLLEDNGIKVNKVTQTENEFIIAFPQAFHQGFNYGFNISEAVNFATDRWVPHGIDWNSKPEYLCSCRPDSVKIDVESFCRKLGIDIEKNRSKSPDFEGCPSSPDFDDEARDWKAELELDGGGSGHDEEEIIISKKGLKMKNDEKLENEKIAKTQSKPVKQDSTKSGKSKSSVQKHDDKKLSDKKPTKNPTDLKPAEQKPTDQKPDEQKPNNQKPTETTPSRKSSSDSKSSASTTSRKRSSTKKPTTPTKINKSKISRNSSSSSTGSSIGGSSDEPTSEEEIDELPFPKNNKINFENLQAYHQTLSRIAPFCEICHAFTKSKLEKSTQITKSKICKSVLYPDWFHDPTLPSILSSKTPTGQKTAVIAHAESFDPVDSTSTDQLSPAKSIILTCKKCYLSVHSFCYLGEEKYKEKPNQFVCEPCKYSPNSAFQTPNSCFSCGEPGGAMRQVSSSGETRLFAHVLCVLSANEVRFSKPETRSGLEKKNFQKIMKTGQKCVYYQEKSENKGGGLQRFPGVNKYGNSASSTKCVSLIKCSWLSCQIRFNIRRALAKGHTAVWRDGTLDFCCTNHYEMEHNLSEFPWPGYETPVGYSVLAIHPDKRVHEATVVESKKWPKLVVLFDDGSWSETTPVSDLVSIKGKKVITDFCLDTNFDESKKVLDGLSELEACEVEVMWDGGEVYNAKCYEVRWQTLYHIRYKTPKFKQDFPEYLLTDEGDVWLWRDQFWMDKKEIPSMLLSQLTFATL